MRSVSCGVVMRYSMRLALCASVVFLGPVAKASSFETKWALFKPNSAGCIAANAGALDLHVRVNASGSDEGQSGSGLVSGFHSGDMLLIHRKASSAQYALSFTLSALDSREIAPVLSLGELEPSEAQISVEDQARYVVPPGGAGWALFSSTTAANGEGEITVTVRCTPSKSSDPVPTS
jgi:hypothetical protein